MGTNVTVTRNAVETSEEHGAAALSRLRAARLPVTPRNYAVWYAYCAGDDEKLKAGVDRLLASREALAQDDLDSLYARYFAPGLSPQVWDSYGARLIGEIKHSLTAFDDALNSASRHSAGIADLARGLAGSPGPAELRATLARLAAMVKDVSEDNRAFEAKLNQSTRTIGELQSELEAARSESLIDSLTLLGNRKSFDRSIEDAVRNAGQDNTPVSLLMADIDRFKSFNDWYGHLVGDQVLRLVATALKQNTRPEDMVARFGGEEFAIILPQAELHHAINVAERLRTAVASRPLVNRSTKQRLCQITISIGVATLRRREGARALIERADHNLNAAKSAGRNRVVAEDPLAEPSLADRPPRSAGRAAAP
jgi:diguanylate cyclase